MYKARINHLFESVFGDEFRHRLEKLFIWLGIGGFLVHLLFYLLISQGIIQLNYYPEDIFSSPISAIYTPFSFILVYEIYLLLYFLPFSFTYSVAKQFEIIALIVIRGIFKDISKIRFDYDLLQYEYNQKFLADSLGFLLLFYLIYWFHRLKGQTLISEPSERVSRFITAKKTLCLFLLVILFVLAIYSLVDWIREFWAFELGLTTELSDINHVFYNEFFTILILADVLILMISFLYTDRYSQLIRNCGFIVATVFIRFSFSSEGILNIILILIGAFFGVIILAIYIQMERAELPQPKKRKKKKQMMEATK